MTQVAVPISDDFTGAWTPVPLFPQINGSPGGGGIKSGTTSDGAACEVKLTGLAYPKPGAETLAVSMSGDGTITATIILLQGNKVIAFKTVTPGSAGSFLIELTDAQKALITNYADLHVEIIAGNVGSTGCASDMPPVLYATFSGATGTCGCLNGVSVPMAWNGSIGGWSGQGGACDGSLSFSVFYSSGNWFLINNSGGSCALEEAPMSGTCGVNNTNLHCTTGVNGCCIGSVTVTVTG